MQSLFVPGPRASNALFFSQGGGGLVATASHITADLSHNQVREAAYATTSAGPFVSRLQCDCHVLNPDSCVAPGAVTQPFQVSPLSQEIMHSTYKSSPGNLSAQQGYLRLRAAPSIMQ